jgi:hypothetical protein
MDKKSPRTRGTPQVQPTTRRSVPESTCDGTGVVSHAGTVLLAELADRIGLTALLSETTDGLRERNVARVTPPVIAVTGQVSRLTPQLAALTSLASQLHADVQRLQTSVDPLSKSARELNSLNQRVTFPSDKPGNPARTARDRAGPQNTVAVPGRQSRATARQPATAERDHGDPAATARHLA